MPAQQLHQFACTLLQEEEENMGDVDLWAITPNSSGLTVNGKWLQHLQDRLLGEDGHPRKVGRLLACM